MDKVTRDTREHIQTVRNILESFSYEFVNRGWNHDASKLEEPEISLFAEWSQKLSQMEYGSDEYKEALENMGPALQHHYEHNRHHPEHFPRGIMDMNLFDILEMLADWKAAGERVKEGSMNESLAHNITRFNIPFHLAITLSNTAADLGWISTDEKEE